MKSNEFDSIIFDCDGVLIDVTKSYDTTINKTIRYVLKELDCDFTQYLGGVPLHDELLLKFKSTGGFNDEIDIAYAGILCYVAAKIRPFSPYFVVDDMLRDADDGGIAYIENKLQAQNWDDDNNTGNGMVFSDVIVPVLSKKFSADFTPLSSALSITSKMSSVGFLFNFLAAI